MIGRKSIGNAHQEMPIHQKIEHQALLMVVNAYRWYVCRLASLAVNQWSTRLNLTMFCLPQIRFGLLSWVSQACPFDIRWAGRKGGARMTGMEHFQTFLIVGLIVVFEVLCDASGDKSFRTIFIHHIPLPCYALSYAIPLPPPSIDITPILIAPFPFLLLRQVGSLSLTIICSQLNRRMLNHRENLFRLTEPHPSQRFSCTEPSLAHHSSPPHQGVPADALRKTQLKFRYLHRLDVQAIDRKYDLLEKLKRITRVSLTGEGDQRRGKQYSIESYYLFNENEPKQRRYQLQRHHPQRNKSHDNLHLQALPNQELIKHQLNDHRQFLERFKPKQKEPLLAKRFRFYRHTHGKLRAFE